jgi:hypothetical protein
MTVIADERVLYLLEFADRRGLERQLERLRVRLKAELLLGTHSQLLASNLNLLHISKVVREGFDTPLAPLGSAFQNRVECTAPNPYRGDAQLHPAGPSSGQTSGSARCCPGQWSQSVRYCHSLPPCNQR